MRFQTSYGFYELNPFPGCNQLVISAHAFVRSELRGRGFGQWDHVCRLAKAEDLGYDCIICTVRADNEVERHILKKNNWSQLFEFTNKETGHRVQIWARELPRESRSNPISKG